MAKYLKLFKDDSERIPYETSGYTEPYVSLTKDSKKYSGILAGDVEGKATKNGDGTFTFSFNIGYAYSVNVSSMNSLIYMGLDSLGTPNFSELTGITATDGVDSTFEIDNTIYYGKWVENYGAGWELHEDPNYEDEAKGSVSRLILTEIDNGQLLHYNKQILATLTLDDDSTAEISGWYKSGWPYTSDEDEEDYGILTNTMVAPYADRVIGVTIENGFKGCIDPPFAQCNKLKNVVISSGASFINGELFAGCPSLETITVDPNNRKFNSENNCNGIIETETNILVCGCKNTVIPNYVTMIGSNSYNGRSNLTNITIPNNIELIGGGAFSNCSGLTSITIPGSVKSIGWGAFSACENLANVTISEGVEELVGYCFSNCHSLTSVTIPNSVTTMEDGIFQNCSSLPSITFPSGMTSIGFGVIYRCSSLSSITVLATTPPTLETYNNVNANLYVPAESVELYKAAPNWSAYKNRTYPIPQN